MWQTRHYLPHQTLQQLPWFWALTQHPPMMILSALKTSLSLTEINVLAVFRCSIRIMVDAWLVLQILCGLQRLILVEIRLAPTSTLLTILELQIFLTHRKQTVFWVLILWSLLRLTLYVPYSSRSSQAMTAPNAHMCSIPTPVAVWDALLELNGILLLICASSA